ncbi:MAG: DUF4160 domain-containing protein [Acidobacteriota bacterium]
MPNITKIGGYRFFFYSNDGVEPPHVHVRRERCSAKFWLSPVDLERSTRFVAHELNEIRQIVTRNREQFLEAWNEHFGT